MSIAANIATIDTQLRQAEEAYGRVHNSVRLLAVSKQQSISKIEEAIAAGQQAFGENYCQEAIEKIDALRSKAVEWHFIGDLQSNKTAEVAANFSWVHSVARQKIAERLNAQRPDTLPPLNVCIQVNISNEQSKSGVALEDVLQLARIVSQLDRLRLRGLMVIPAVLTDFAKQRGVFESVAAAQQALIRQGFALDTLSMGMTHDYLAAVAAGSTMVRIGTGIFGPRQS